MILFLLLIGVVSGARVDFLPDEVYANQVLSEHGPPEAAWSSVRHRAIESTSQTNTYPLVAPSALLQEASRAAKADVYPPDSQQEVHRDARALQPVAAAANITTKLVFAHYMLCFSAFGNNVAGYQREMQIAQDNGIDAFGLEVLGREWYYLVNFRTFLSACEQYNAKNTTKAPFKVFLIINFCCNLNMTDAVYYYRLSLNSSCLLRPVIGQPECGAMSSWSALNWRNNFPNASHWQSQFFDVLSQAGLGKPFFMPFTYPPNYAETPTQANVLAILDTGFPPGMLDVYWMWGCANLGDAIRNASLAAGAACASRGMMYMAPWSAPYSPHVLNNNRVKPCAGSQCIEDLWTAHISTPPPAQPSFVTASTWNDLTEHHYIGPYEITANGGRLRQDQRWPHVGYLELSRYFIQWYKMPYGSPPPRIVPGAVKNATSFPEQLFYFHNLQYIGNNCSEDPLRRPGYAFNARYPLEDRVYATTLLAAPANITIISGANSSGAGGNATQFVLPAGLASVKAPVWPGYQRFIIRRNGNVLVDVVSAQRFNSSDEAPECNGQTYTGTAVLAVEPSPSPSSSPSPSTTVTATASSSPSVSGSASVAASSSPSPSPSPSLSASASATRAAATTPAVAGGGSAGSGGASGINEGGAVDGGGGASASGSGSGAAAASGGSNRASDPVIIGSAIVVAIAAVGVMVALKRRRSRLIAAPVRLPPGNDPGVNMQLQQNRRARIASMVVPATTNPLHHAPFAGQVSTVVTAEASTPSAPADSGVASAAVPVAHPAAFSSHQRRAGFDSTPIVE